jgi:Na+/H+ antiporter NhaD/arsenite permease-like protein
VPDVLILEKYGYVTAKTGKGGDMVLKKTVYVFVAMFILSAVTPEAGARESRASGESIPPSAEENTVSFDIAGIITDSHDEPVPEVDMILSDGEEILAETVTGRDGKYIFRFMTDPRRVSALDLKMTVKKSSFATQTLDLSTGDMCSNGPNYALSRDIRLVRTLGPAFWISTIIFVAAYLLISFELLHRTVAAMLGAALMLGVSYTFGTLNFELRIFSFESAVHSIDMNVIFLLLGMMVIVGIFKRTGVFQWCAYMSYRLAKGSVFLLAVYLMTFTAVTSAFLDNVTTMLLITGVAIEICLSLQINPLAMLIPMILASNIGGTATLIGDPPNIMIGSYAGLTFMDFVVALFWVCFCSTVALLLFSKFVWGKDYAKARVEDVPRYIEELRHRYQITDMGLLLWGLFLLAFVIFLFLSHGFWHMEVSIAALLGASVFLVIALATKKVDLFELIEKDIEWPTLMFFIFLFIIVGAVESAGLLALIADWILDISGGDFIIACSLILWVSAIMSAFVDNIPFTATMLPIVAYLSSAIPGSENTLWWALALGACFGGNGTMIGASANVVTIGIAESQGYKITFFGYFKTAFPYMVISVLIAHAWLLIFRPA